MDESDAARAARLAATESLTKNYHDARRRLDVVAAETAALRTATRAIAKDEDEDEREEAQAFASAQAENFRAKEAAAEARLQAARQDREALEIAIAGCSDALRIELAALEETVQQQQQQQNVAQHGASTLQQIERAMNSARRRLDAASKALQERSASGQQERVKVS